MVDAAIETCVYSPENFAVNARTNFKLKHKCKETATNLDRKLPWAAKRVHLSTGVVEALTRCSVLTLAWVCSQASVLSSSSDVTLRRHVTGLQGRDSTIFDDRKHDKKGLPAFTFPLARDKEEKSRGERGRKLSFWETFLRLFSNSATWREKSFTGDPFLLTFLRSKRAESLPC